MLLHARGNTAIQHMPGGQLRARRHHQAVAAAATATGGHPQSAVGSGRAEHATQVVIHV